MAKHDDDNRSNQLNPNNNAYWSSRGYGGGGGDSCEDGVAPALSGRLCSINTSAFKVDPATQWQTNPEGVRERFFLDVLLADGRTVNAELTVRFPFKGFSAYRLHKCADLLNLIGPAILSKLEAVASCAVVQPVWKDASGSVLETTYDFHTWTPARPFLADAAANAFIQARAGQRSAQTADLGMFGPNSIYPRSSQIVHFGTEVPVEERTFDFRLENVAQRSA